MLVRIIAIVYERIERAYGFSNSYYCRWKREREGKGKLNDACVEFQWDFKIVARAWKIPENLEIRNRIFLLSTCNFRTQLFFISFQPTFYTQISTNLIRCVDNDGLAFGIVESIHGSDLHHARETIEENADEDNDDEQGAPDGRAEKSSAVVAWTELNVWLVPFRHPPGERWLESEANEVNRLAGCWFPWSGCFKSQISAAEAPSFTESIDATSRVVKLIVVPESINFPVARCIVNLQDDVVC